TFFDERPLLVTTDSHHTVGVEDELAHREPLANLGAVSSGPVHQDLVQVETSRGVVGVDSAVRRRLAGQGDVVQAHHEVADPRSPDRFDVAEQAPIPQQGGARALHVVGRNRVARELVPINDQDPVALSGEQHGERCAATTRADYDRVVHRIPFSGSFTLAWKVTLDYLFIVY